ncbi:hypothetical protein GQX74_003440 [Glossina fuscipes]|nr:hypothetical protein GQX74_003440 [Glossina fuscipes]
MCGSSRTMLIPTVEKCFSGSERFRAPSQVDPKVAFPRRTHPKKVNDQSHVRAKRFRSSGSSTLIGLNAMSDVIKSTIKEKFFFFNITISNRGSNRSSIKHEGMKYSFWNHFFPAFLLIYNGLFLFHALLVIPKPYHFEDEDEDAAF